MRKYVPCLCTNFYFTFRVPREQNSFLEILWVSCICVPAHLFTHSAGPWLVLGAFTGLWITLMHETTQELLDRFSWNLILISMKAFRCFFFLRLGKFGHHYARRHICISAHILLNIYFWRKIFVSCREKWNAFLFNTLSL